MVFKYRKATTLFMTISVFWLLSVGSAQHPPLHQKKEHEAGDRLQIHGGGQSEIDNRTSLGLTPEAQQAHETIMREHLEAIYQIVAALARENFAQAKKITERELGFEKHRQAMRRQKPEEFPPSYHDLAMAHHRAAEKLAQAMDSKNMKHILAPFERTLYACVQCHKQYKR